MQISDRALSLINETPAIQSILYDLNLLPEQVETYAGRMALYGVCAAYTAGRASNQEKSQ